MTQSSILFLSLFSLLSPLARAQTQDAPAPERVEIAVEALLAPYTGYEEKNTVQVVLYGILPNNCYTLEQSVVQKQDEHSFRVTQFALHDVSGACADESTLPEHLQMAIPFTQEVTIGRLAAGDYRFDYDKAGTGPDSRPLHVSTNINNGADTLPYAAVSGLHAKDVVMSIDHLVVTLSGVLNSSCTQLVPETQVMRENDVLVLLPTIRVRHGVMCAQVMIPFEKKIDLGVLAPGIHLIQSRSMNGRAVNKVVIVSR